MMLPSDLRQFQNELAGRLALHEDPGTEIRTLRDRYGYTQEALAQLLELRRESLSRIESGRTNLTLPILQRFTRIITLSRAIREHLAYAEARGNLPDTRMFDALATSLRLPKTAADEVVLNTMMAYDQKRRQTIRNIPGHDASGLTHPPQRGSRP